MFAENPDTQTNKDLYDGLIDIKNQTGFITISWNYLHDQHKGGLVGASDTDLFADRKITYHHNYYNKVKLRVPMYRGSVGHFFNNYIVGATDATEIRAGTCVRDREELLRGAALLDLHDLGFRGQHRANRQRRSQPHVAGLSRQLHGRHPVPVRRRADEHDQRREDRRSRRRGRRKDLARDSRRAYSGVMAPAPRRPRKTKPRDKVARRASAKRRSHVVLFSGPSPAARKAAAALAHASGKDLMRIDLTSVVSKHIGETAKNLSRVFARAERANAVLFFDEAESLFGKRTTVSDAHDRLANIDANYLLQRFEDFSGPLIVAIRARSAIASAFVRRFALVVDFASSAAGRRERKPSAH